MNSLCFERASHHPKRFARVLYKRVSLAPEASLLSNHVCPIVSISRACLQARERYVHVCSGTSSRSVRTPTRIPLRTPTIREMLCSCHENGRFPDTFRLLGTFFVFAGPTSSPPSSSSPAESTAFLLRLSSEGPPSSLSRLAPRPER